MINFKYRAWDRKAGRMFDVSGVFLHQTNPDVICIQGFQPEHSGVDWFQKIDVGLMQFTGLIDKNGKEIFEGDIVENGLSGTWIVQPLEGGSFSLLGVCEKYKDSNFLISALNDHAEVIGNIYENSN